MYTHDTKFKLALTRPLQRKYSLHFHFPNSSAVAIEHRQSHLTRYKCMNGLSLVSRYRWLKLHTVIQSCKVWKTSLQQCPGQDQHYSSVESGNLSEYKQWLLACSPFATATIGYNTACSPFATATIGHKTACSLFDAATIGYRTACSLFDTATIGYSTACSPFATATIGYSTACSLFDTATIVYNTACSLFDTITIGYRATSSAFATATIGYSTTCSLFDTATIGYNTACSAIATATIGYGTTGSLFASATLVTALPALPFPLPPLVTGQPVPASLPYKQWQKTGGYLFSNRAKA